jgi:hypothetical protein
VANYARILYFGSWCAVILMLPAHAVAQVAPVPQDSSSCRRFVQQFYDWYVPLTHASVNGPASDSALKHKAEVFNPDLLRALKLDSEASAHAKGEVVGLDFDPFVGSQDPADRYEARHVTWRENKCSVEVWDASPADPAAKSKKPDVVADVVIDRGHWQFLNFRYPELNADLVNVLARLREERRKR